MVVGSHVDGLSRWDVPVGNCLCLDTEAWPAKRSYSEADGRSGSVRVMHAPNHRGVKGTERIAQHALVRQKAGKNEKSHATAGSLEKLAAGGPGEWLRVGMAHRFFRGDRIELQWLGIISVAEVVRLRASS